MVFDCLFTITGYSAILFFLLLILYDFGPPSVKYNIKILIYYLSLTFFGLITIPVSFIKRGGPHVDNLHFPAAIMSTISSLIGVEWQIDHPERLSSDRTHVVVVNHQHSVDVLGLFHMVPMLRKCTILSKMELLYAGPFGMAAWVCGTTFVKRGTGSEARKMLTEKVLEAKKEGTKVVVFPEGTRHQNPKEKEMLPFKKGAFASAIEAQVPILPVVIQQYRFMDVRKKIFGSAKVKVKVLEAVEVERYKGLGSEAAGILVDEVREMMFREFCEM